MIAIRCAGASLSLIGEDRVERVDGVGVFNYLEQTLEKSDDNWTVVFHNIQKVQQV